MMLKHYTSRNVAELISLLEGRGISSNDALNAAVTEIIGDVRKNGDAALYKYTKKFDNTDLDSLYLSDEKKESLIARVPSELRGTLERAAENIRSFHEKQKQQSWVDIKDGTVMGQRVLPLRRAGLYIPGGSAAYPSSILMCAIPAQVAGVNEIIAATPTPGGSINPAIVYAASLAGVGDILTVGGAQAVAALAYGTESVRRVDKIVGPGNIYVSAAKRLVYGTVDIDMIAGPSEVLIIADGHADASYIAADLMAQAEHDELAASILITTSPLLAEKVEAALAEQLKGLSRRDKIAASLSNYGSVIVTDTLEEAARLSDLIAPEHLELAVDEPFALLSLIHNAGSVFLGEYTPEPLGDYMAGPNHVLPTNGTARFSSALSVDDFMKKSSYLYFNNRALRGMAGDVIRFADTEGLDAHANSVKIRMGRG
ncbi:MAG: histidinol dehydrogenase [Eubacteriales bacterium]|jgi:histidinol dehydrogenase|nr:histidinol dehydrogenase [Eubacteriales bacterium]